MLASCWSAWRSAAVAFREVTVVEVREVLRGWLEGAGLRKVAERAGVDGKTVRYADPAVMPATAASPLVADQINPSWSA
jgi:hypothetical protein